MKNINYDIFISYRRLDEHGNISGRDQARLIAKQLQLEGFTAFFDYSEIKDNEFDKVIIPAIENCKIFILVLTKDSLNRCQNEDDWVRREIETAIRTKCKIINATPDGAFTGWPETLPDSLVGIKTIEISEIHFGSLFEVSVNKMIDDRICSIIPRPEKQNNYLANFNNLIVGLYGSTVDYRDELKVNNLVDNKFFFVMQDYVKKIFSISEVYRYHDKTIYNNAKSIVEQYNKWIAALRKQFSSNGSTDVDNLYAANSSKEFGKFVDVVTKALDTSLL